MKKFNEFVKSKKTDKKINEEIVWFRHFNKESDDFMNLLEAVIAGNKDGFIKAVSEFVLQIKNNKVPTSEIFKPVITDKVFEEYYKIGLKWGIIGYNFEDFKEELINKNCLNIFPSMLIRGVKSEMKDGGSELIPFTTGEAREYLGELSVERGKEKLGNMLQNKGIIKEE